MNLEQDPGEHLSQLLAAAGLGPLQLSETKQLTDYLSLLQRWNARTNLTAVRDADSMLQRHFVESIACAQALPTEIHTLLDFGSGAGFPGLPIAICRPQIAVTLAESQGKKAAFLREAVRVTCVSAQVHNGRAETLATEFDCVTLRAVDQMEAAVQAAARLVAPEGWLAPLSTRGESAALQAAAGPAFSWVEPVPLPYTTQGILLLGKRS